jgi:UDP-N-acetylmuramate dehydrogenase
MMAASLDRASALLERLPEVRGTYRAQAPLSDLTWFRVGGPAEVLFRPADQADLATFLKAKPADVPVTVLGVGSNVLVRSGGIAGVTLRLAKPFTEILVEENAIFAGAAALDMNVARVARNAGLTGLEFLSGIPGTIGGALRMNAGAYGSETKDVLLAAETLDANGKLLHLAPEDMGHSYRHCALPEDLIFLSARLRARPGDRETIAKRMEEIRTSRHGSQPIGSRTGGSTFKNPNLEDSGGRKAWQLIDAAGCRGLRVGDAMVSEQHCNFLINCGEATADDLERLGEEVRARVLEDSGVSLQWEIKRLGNPGGEPGTESSEART